MNNGLMFRFTAVIAAMSIAISSMGMGLEALFNPHSKPTVHRPKPENAPQYSEAPRQASPRPNPGRSRYRHWWNDSKIAELAQIDAQNAIEHGQFDGIFACLNLGDAIAMQVGGGGIGAGTGPGEGSLSGGGSQTEGGHNSAGGSGTGAIGDGSSGGIPPNGTLGGSTNTHTGNKLSILEIVNIPSRGDTILALNLYHNSLDNRRLWMGWSWRCTYDVEIDTGTSGTAFLRMPDGLIIPYTQSGASYIAPAGWPHQLVHNGGGTWTLTLKNQAVWEFNSAGWLTKVSDRWGNDITVNRGTGDEITSVVDDASRTLTFAYSSGMVSTITGPNSKVWTFAYVSNNLTKVYRPTFNTFNYGRAFTYNANHDILTETDLRSNVWSWTYDSSERCTSYSNPYSNTVSFTYNTGDTTIALPMSSSGSQVWTHEYNTNGELTAIEDPDGYRVEYTYNGNIDVTSLEDQRGKVWDMTYDSNKNLLTLENPLGKTWEFTYTALNDIDTFEDPLNNVTDFVYNVNGSLHQIKDPTNQVVKELTYDGYGQLDTVEDALGRTTDVDIDGHGVLIEVTNPANVTTQATYNDYGKVLTVENPGASNQKSFTYDVWNRVTNISKPGTSNDIDITYDLENLPLSITDELGKTTLLSYDNAMRMTSVTNARGDVEDYTYNANSWLTQRENGNNEDTNYSYIDRGEVYQIDQASMFFDQYTYAPTGEVTRCTPYSGSYVEYDLDDAGRLDSIDYLDSGTADVDYDYDDANRVIEMIDGIGTSEWHYNSRSLITQIVQPQGTIDYRYNIAHELIEMDGPGGTTEYDLDATTGQLDGIDNAFGEDTLYLYDGLGRLDKTTYSSGAYEVNGYDAQNRLISVDLKNSSNTLLKAQDFAFNDASQLTQQIIDGVTTNFTYDDIGQLLTESRSGYSAAYTYDSNGNRATRTINSRVETHSYDPADMLASVYDALGTPSTGDDILRDYFYTLDGELEEKKVNGISVEYLTWNADERLTSFDNYTTTTSYAYNGSGARVEKGTQDFLRNGTGATSAVLDDGSAVYTPGISERRASTTTLAHSGLKSAQFQSGSSQTVTASKSYDAFGNPDAASGTWQGPFTYAGGFGYQQNSESNYMLLGHRYYDPAIGGF